MVIHENTLRAAEDNIKMLLNQVFEEKVTFDPIKVESTSDHYGDDNLNIIVVYDGDYDQLDPEKLNQVSMELASILSGFGFHNMPTESYIDKREYKEWIALMDQAPWEQEVE
jgi:hypothetical protein